MACGCASGTCNCVILPGDGIDISGAGTVGDPLIISAEGGGAGITVTDTDSVDLTLTGINLTAAVRRDPEATNLITSSAAGLDVSREAVQDAVGAAASDGLIYDDAGNQLRVRISADVGNVAQFGVDHGVYVPPAPSNTVVNVLDTPSVDLTKSGIGTPGDPYVISGAVKLSADPVNEAAFGTDGGLYVSSRAQASPRLAQGAVVFTWDDGWDTHPAVADMHAARKQRATFYITTNLLGTSQHMAAAAVAPMVAQGHEIGAHSADHLDMTTLTPVTRAPQWASQQTLETLIGGGYQVRSYAYPFGTHNLTTDQEAYGRFDRIASVGLAQGFAGSSASAGQWMYEPNRIDGFRHGRFPWSQTTHAQFMQILRDYVLKRPVVLTAYAHQIGNPDTPTLIQVTEAMDFCQANGIPCLTSAQAFPGPKVVNPGFESSIDSGWVVITAGTGATGLTVDSFTDAPSAGLPGTKSLRIISPNTSTASDTVEVMQTFPVEGDKTYSFSGRIRHDATPVGAGAGVKLRINEVAGDGTIIAGRAVSGTASTTAWTQGVVTPTALNDGRTIAGRSHPEARYWEVGVRVNNVTGTFYADHMYFGPTEAAGAIG